MEQSNANRLTAMYREVVSVHIQIYEYVNLDTIFAWFNDIDIN